VQVPRDRHRHERRERRRESTDPQARDRSRRSGRYGLQTMCEGGGQANATILERV
jgi:acetyl-CoA acetyltransferase